MRQIGNLWMVLGKAFVPFVPSIVHLYDIKQVGTETVIKHKTSINIQSYQIHHNTHYQTPIYPEIYMKRQTEVSPENFKIIATKGGLGEQHQVMDCVDF